MEAGEHEWRMIVSDTASTSLTIVVEFESTMAVGEQFLSAPYSIMALDDSAEDDANLAVNTTTALTEADGDIAAGTGGEAHVISIGMRDELSSYVEFVLTAHQYGPTDAAT